MRFLVYIFLLFSSLTVIAQDKAIKSDISEGQEVFKPVETMPEYKGGMVEMFKFIQKNLIYPEEAKKKQIVGQPIVRFVVESTGKLSNIQIRQSSGNKLLDDEAIRIVSIMPDWKPGSQNGQNVSVYFNLPINFNINGKLDDFKRTQKQLANKYYNDGVRYFGENNFIMAKESFSKALSLNCFDTDSKYNLGATYLKLNQKDSACVIWNDLKTSFNQNDKDEAEKLIKKYCTN